LVDREVVPAQRPSGAVHGRERRPQLMRGRRDELRLELIEAARLRDVAECVNGAAEEVHAHHREPALSIRRLEWNGFLMPRIRCALDRDSLGDLLPVGENVRRRTMKHGARSESRHSLGGWVPQLNYPWAVEKEDAVRHECE